MEYGVQPDFYYGRPELFFGPNAASPYPGRGGAITAYDLNRGEILWQVSGAWHDAVIGNSAALVTDTLLFYKNSSLGSLNVIDKATGEFIAAIPLGGKQYVVVASGRQDEHMQLVALVVP